jgi:ribose-phosphate pyrophosphokinase
MHRVFALSASRDIGTRIAAAAGVALTPAEEREFEDGEFKARPLDSVAGATVFVVQGLHGDGGGSASDRLVRLLFFGATLRDHGAARVVAVLPYLAFGRKDRRTQPFDPVATRYVAQQVEAAGFTGVIALEVHNDAAFDNAFRIPAVHVPAAAAFVPEVVARVGNDPVVVASPDPGGVKRAQLFREALVPALGRDCASAYLEKRRAGGVVSGDLLAGDVRGATVVLVDDLISTGGTLARAARTCMASGARRVIACAAHGVFAPGAEAALLDSALAEVIVTDSVGPAALPAPAQARLHVVPASPQLAAALRAALHG